jgi:hypothetical protein
LCFFPGRRLDIGLWIDRVVLLASRGVQQDLCSLLDAFEEGVVLGKTCCGLLVGVMAENLFAMGTLDLSLRGLEAVLG